MFWYLLNIVIVVIIWNLPVTIECWDYSATELIHNIRTKRVCIIGTINWIILSGFRSLEVGPDTLAYKLYRFDRTINRSWSELFGDFVLKYKMGQDIKDPGYPILEKIFQVFSTNYQIWLITIAIIFFVPLGIAIYKNSSNACISYILFSTLFYSFFAITGHRQTIATALVVMIGMKYIKENKLLPFLIIEIVAITIHASAICFLPFYWISKIKINKFSISAYWLAIIIAFIGKNQFVKILQFIVGYEEYGQTEGARASSFLYLLIGLAIVITFFYKNYYKREISMHRIAINAVFVAAVFSPLLLINQAFMRVIQYYSLFLLFLVPDVIKIFKQGVNQQIVSICISIIMLLLFLSNNPTYSFCF